MICVCGTLRLDGSDGSSDLSEWTLCIYKVLSVDVSTRLLSVGNLSGLQGVFECRHLIGSTRRLFHRYRNKGVSSKFILNVDGVSTRHMNVDGDLQGIKLCTNKCTISFVVV